MNIAPDNICAECSSPSNLETMWIMSQRFSGDDDVLARIIRMHVIVVLLFRLLNFQSGPLNGWSSLLFVSHRIQREPND